MQDIGRLHAAAAAIFNKVQRQRIFGFAARYNWDDILRILRKLEPGKTFPEDFSGGEDPNEIVARPKAEQLLRDLGREGWTTLEESVANMVQQLSEPSSPHLFLKLSSSRNPELTPHEYWDITSAVKAANASSRLTTASLRCACSSGCENLSSFSCIREAS